MIWPRSLAFCLYTTVTILSTENSFYCFEIGQKNHESKSVAEYLAELSKTGD